MYLENKLNGLPLINPSLVDGEVPYCERIFERAIVTYDSTERRRVTEVLFIFGRTERWNKENKKISQVIGAKRIDGFWKEGLVEYTKREEIPFQNIFLYETIPLPW